MTLTNKDVAHIAKLSKLEITKEDIKKYSKQLSKVVDYIKQLQEVDTKGTKAILRTSELKNVSSEDIINVEEMLSQKEALSSAPKKHNNYFISKAVIDKES